MFSQLFQHFATKIKLQKAIEATSRITVVVRYLLLASLFYLPLCMQARSENFVRDASLLEDEYQVFWTLKGYGRFRRRADPETQIEWLNGDPTQLDDLRRLAIGWKSHIEHCQLKWTKGLGCIIPIAVTLIDSNGSDQNRILVCLVVVRGTLAALHLLAFHVIVYPSVKELDFLIKYLSDVANLCSPLWLLLSLPLASILWFTISALVLAFTLVFKSSITSPDGSQPVSMTFTIFICIILDAVPTAWIYYRFKRLD